MSAGLTGPVDLRDQQWLDEQVAILGHGIEAARAIWSNWCDGRHVGRLYPDQSPGEYIASRGYRLTLAEAMAALPDGSTREVAAVAGVSHDTVGRARRSGGRNLPGDEILEADEPPRVIGADGKSYPGRVIRQVRAAVIEPTARPDIGAPFWPELLAVRDAIRNLSAVSPDILAGNVPARRRRRFAKDLRRHGLILGAIAARLEDME